jgi:hypothetical protein
MDRGSVSLTPGRDIAEEVRKVLAASCVIRRQFDEVTNRSHQRRRATARTVAINSASLKGMCRTAAAFAGTCDDTTAMHGTSCVLAASRAGWCAVRCGGTASITAASKGSVSIRCTASVTWFTHRASSPASLSAAITASHRSRFSREHEDTERGGARGIGRHRSARNLGIAYPTRG